MAKQKRDGHIVQTIKTPKGRWEIYVSPDKTKKRTKVLCENGLTVVGCWEYCNRLIQNNGNLICSNTGFNAKAGAIKNMKSVQRTAS